VNFQELMNAAIELQVLIHTLKPENGNLRWEMLQDWLKSHPQYKKRINHYLTVTSVEAVGDLKRYICRRADISPAVLQTLINANFPALEIQARSAIETIQQLYRERLTSERQEITT